MESIILYSLSAHGHHLRRRQRIVLCKTPPRKGKDKEKGMKRLLVSATRHLLYKCLNMYMSIGAQGKENNPKVRKERKERKKKGKTPGEYLIK